MTADIFEELLYQSLPLPTTQPALLAANASLFGLDPPRVENARVLEMGCASGGNIIPLAVRFPDATFHGLDISSAEIAIARERANALGLSNISFEAIDIADFAGSPEPFDYIISHGVFSWAPEHVRAAILRISGACLSADGLAYISFNVLPGWRMQQIVRDLCMRFEHGSPRERTDAARHALTEIARGAGEGHPYGRLVAQAARRLAGRPVSYVFSEFIAPINECFFFKDFAAMAAREGLSYVCESELAASSAEFFAPAASLPVVRELAGDDPLAVQQCLDDISGRTHRSAVLAKKPPGQIQAPPAERLHAATMLSAHADAPGVFHTSANLAVREADETVAKALATLACAAPGTLAVADLARAATDKTAFLRAMLRHAGAGNVTLYAAPITVGRADAPAPRAFAVARLEAARGLKWVTTLQHRAAAPSPDALELLTVLDGVLPRSALASKLHGAGEGSAEQRVDAALRFLEREALLSA